MSADQPLTGQWRVRCSCGKRFTGAPDAVEAWSRQHDDSPLKSHIVSWDVPGVQPWSRPEREVSRHNHLTRDIKNEGQCPDCDRYWKASR